MILSTRTSPTTVSPFLCRTGSRYAKEAFQRIPFQMLTGDIAAPTFSSMSFRSVVWGIPLSTIASRQAPWNGVISSGANCRTRKRVLPPVGSGEASLLSTNRRCRQRPSRRSRRGCPKARCSRCEPSNRLSLWRAGVSGRVARRQRHWCTTSRGCRLRCGHQGARSASVVLQRDRSRGRPRGAIPTDRHVQQKTRYGRTGSAATDDYSVRVAGELRGCHGFRSSGLKLADCRYRRLGRHLPQAYTRGKALLLCAPPIAIIPVAL